MTDAQAAAVTTAHATAWYGLHDQARIAAGDRVLIHSATGGVDRRRSQSPAPRGPRSSPPRAASSAEQLLHDMGIEHVYDSRSTEFAEQIRRDTDGYGVDIVLNSLTGAAQRAGMELLATGGRFVEIGKRDVYANNRLELFPFRRNLTFHDVDLGLMAASHPQRVGDLLGTVYQLVADGSLPMPQSTHYPLGDAATAIRAISAAAQRASWCSTSPGPGAAASWYRPSRPALPPRRLLHHHRRPGWPRALSRREDGHRRLWPHRVHLPLSTHPKALETIELIRAMGADIVVACGDIAEPAPRDRLVAPRPLPDFRCAGCCTRPRWSRTPPWPTSPTS